MVEYDPLVVTFEELLGVFWKTHDPTQVTFTYLVVVRRYPDATTAVRNPSRSTSDDRVSPRGRGGWVLFGRRRSVPGTPATAVDRPMCSFIQPTRSSCHSKFQVYPSIQWAPAWTT